MKNTRAWIEGAVVLLTYIIMIILAVFVPLLNIVIQFFLIFPFLYYGARHSTKSSVLLIIISSFISYIVGSYIGLFLTLLFGTTGLVMGYCIQSGKGKVNTYIASSIVFMANLIISFVFAAIVFNKNFLDEFSEIYESSIKQYSDALGKIGQAPPPEFQEQMHEVLNLMSSMAPTMLLVSSFGTVIILMCINLPILKRFGVKVPTFPPFRTLKFPKTILWYYLIVLVLSMIIKVEVGTYWHTALINGAYILQTLLVLQGLSLAFYFSHYKKWSKAIPIILTVFTIILPPVLSIVRVLGIIDIGFNLRERLNKK